MVNDDDFGSGGRTPVGGRTSGADGTDLQEQCQERCVGIYSELTEVLLMAYRNYTITQYCVTETICRFIGA